MTQKIYPVSSFKLFVHFLAVLEWKRKSLGQKGKKNDSVYKAIRELKKWENTLEYSVRFKRKVVQMEQMPTDALHSGTMTFVISRLELID